MKAQRGHAFGKYVGLSLVLVILSLWNYVFNKLFDRLYGNFNVLDVEILSGWIVLFGVVFGISLWYVDNKGIISKMFGQGADIWRMRVKREGFELEVTASSSQEVEALFEKLSRKDSK